MHYITLNPSLPKRMLRTMEEFRLKHYPKQEVVQIALGTHQHSLGSEMLTTCLYVAPRSRCVELYDLYSSSI
jgi:hypothetical protein